MAIKLDAGEVTRTDVTHIYPEHIIALDADNSREIPHTQEEIEALAGRIKEFGQKQPGTVRRIEGNKVKLIAGFGRYKAVKWLNEQEQDPNKKLRYKCIVLADINAEEAFVLSISENLDRLETTPIDDAHAQRRLREEFGWTEEKIAEFYKKSVSYIAQLRKTLQLSKTHQEMVAKEKMNLSTALEVTQLPEAKREEVVASAIGEDGKVNATAVKKKVREHRLGSGEGSLARTMKEVRKFLTEQTKPHEAEPIRMICGKFLEFIKGNISEVTMEAALVEFTSQKEPQK